MVRLEGKFRLKIRRLGIFFTSDIRGNLENVQWDYDLGKETESYKDTEEV